MKATPKDSGKNSELAGALAELTRMVFYILSSDKKAVAVGHLLTPEFRSISQIARGFREQFQQSGVKDFFEPEMNLEKLLTTLNKRQGTLRIIDVKASGSQETYVRLGENGQQIVPHIQYGMVWAISFGKSLMSILGYQQGAAPKLEVIKNRVAFLKEVVKHPEGISVRELSVIIGLEEEKVRLHPAAYLRQTGVVICSDVPIAPMRTSPDQASYVFELPRKKELDYSALKKEVSLEHALNSLASISNGLKPGEAVTRACIFELMGKLGDASKFRILAFLVQNGIVSSSWYRDSLIKPTEIAHSVANTLITPLEESLKGTPNGNNATPEKGVYDHMVQAFAREFQTDPVTAVARVAYLHGKFYKHGRR